MEAPQFLPGLFERASCAMAAPRAAPGVTLLPVVSAARGGSSGNNGVRIPANRRPPRADNLLTAPPLSRAYRIKAAAARSVTVPAPGPSTADKAGHGVGARGRGVSLGAVPHSQSRLRLAWLTAPLTPALRIVSATKPARCRGNRNPACVGMARDESPGALRQMRRSRHGRSSSGSSITSTASSTSGPREIRLTARRSPRRA